MQDKGGHRGHHRRRGRRKESETVSQSQPDRTTAEEHDGQLDEQAGDVPVMVPFTVVPFLSSIVTVSLLSFICVCPFPVAGWQSVKVACVPGRREEDGLTKNLSRRHGGKRYISGVGQYHCHRA